MVDRNAAHKQLPPDPDGENDARASWGQAAITRFKQVTRSDQEDLLSDLLSDLMHWADRNGQDFDEELDRARRAYTDETLGNGEGGKA